VADIVTTPPFWLDHEYDRDNADSRSTSRYGNYLYQSRHQFAKIDYDDPSVEFAALAWRIGTGPIMSPPFIRQHRRVLGATIGRSGWNGEMTIDIDLISSRPRPSVTPRPPTAPTTGTGQPTTTVTSKESVRTI
jgi:hypothetical protein